MLQANQRYVFFYDLFLVTKPATADPFRDPITFSAILPHLKERFDAGQCYKIYQKGRAGARIADMHFDDEHAAFLIAYADKSTADPSFMHVVNGKARTEHKAQEEGGAFSAHLVVKTKPDSIAQMRHLAVLEKAPGATKSIIVPFLNSQFKAASPFFYQNKTKKSVKCWPRFQMLGQKSQELKEALKTGILKDVELINHKA